MMCFIFGTKEGPKDKKKIRQLTRTLTSMEEEILMISLIKRISNLFDEIF